MIRSTAKRIDDSPLSSQEEGGIPRQLTDGAVGVAHIGSDGRILRCNSPFAEMLGYRPEELSGRHAGDLEVVEEDGPQAGLFQELIEGRRRSYQTNVRYRAKDGRIVRAILTMGRARNAEGEAERFVAIVSDLTEVLRTSEALAESEARFRATFENAAVGMALIGTDGTWLRVNQRVCDIVGYTPGELMQLTFQDITHPDDLHIDLGLLQETIEGKRDNYAMEKRYFHKHGRLVWVKLTVGCARSKEGEVDYFISVIEDITSEKRKDVALQQSEEQFRATFENAAIGMAQVAPDGTWLHANRKVCEILGYSEEELRARSFQSVMYPEDLLPELDQIQEMCLGKRSSMQLETRYIRKDGGIVWAALSVASVRNSEGEVEYLILVLDDITEKKQMRRELMESEARFRAVQQVMPDGFMLFKSIRNEEGQIEDFVSEYGNPAALELLSIAPEEVPGYRMLVRDPNTKAMGLYDLYVNVVESGQTAQGELEFPFRSGKIRWFRYSIVKVDDGFGVAFADITEAKESEARLKESEARLRAFVDTTPDGFMIFRSIRDEAGTIQDLRIEYVNPSAVRISGPPANELVGKTMSEIMVTNFDIGTFDRYVEVIETGVPWQGEVCYPRTNGDFWYRTTAAKVRDGVAVSYSDVTERKDHERRLREQDEYLRVILDNVIAFVGLISPEGILLEANELALAAGGLVRDDVIGKPFWEAYWWSHDAEGRKRLQESVAEAAKGERIRYDTVIRTAGDNRLAVDFQLAPIVDENGRVTHIVPSGYDISDRQRAEQQREMLLKELSHRVKNSLATVQTIASHSLREASDLESFRETFVGRLMAISKCHDLLVDTARSRADISQLVRDQVLPYAQGGRDQQVTMSGPNMVLGPEAAHTFGLILHELATNAAKYGALSTEEGRVDIKWRRDSDQERLAVFFTWEEKGGPPVEQPSRRGFGSVLIEQSLSHALGGQAMIEYRPEGLWAQFQFRLRGQ